jgi:hypothetical protein
MNDPKKDKPNDEIAQLLMGVALIGFSVIAFAVLVSARVTEVLGRAY